MKELSNVTEEKAGGKEGLDAASPAGGKKPQTIIRHPRSACTISPWR